MISSTFNSFSFRSFIVLFMAIQIIMIVSVHAGTGISPNGGAAIDKAELYKSTSTASLKRLNLNELKHSALCDKLGSIQFFNNLFITFNAIFHDTTHEKINRLNREWNNCMYI